MLLQGDGTYLESQRSPTFPNVPLAELARFIELGMKATDETAWIRAFRSWVQKQIA